MGLPLKNWVIPLKNMGWPLKNFVKIKASPTTNSIFFYSTPKEILNFYNLPLENSMVPQTGGGGADIKCNNPIFFVSQKKKTFWSLYCRTARILTLPENTPSLQGIAFFFLLKHSSDMKRRQQTTKQREKRPSQWKTHVRVRIRPSGSPWALNSPYQPWKGPSAGT